MPSINIQYYQSPVGEMIIGSYKDKLCLADWRYRKMRHSIDKRLKNYLKADYLEKESEEINGALVQLNEYFLGERKVFDLPLLFAGTDFQKQVWQALASVSYGQTSTYASLSKKIGNEKAVRALANANGANAISIIVPCHRIIGSNGELTGYAGGLAAKERLLKLENSLFTV